VDTSIYFLAPGLQPGSFFLEMNPGTANRPGSGLAGEVARADFLVLTRYDQREEANASSGSAEPKQGVARDFVFSLYDQYQLFKPRKLER
jgi:hypothetical protein